MQDSLDEWVSASDAAVLLGVSRPRVHQLVKRHVLDGRHIAGRLLIHRRSIEIRKESRGTATNGRQPAVPTLVMVGAHKEEILRLAAKHGATNVRVFGSVVSGDAIPESDVDFLVDMEDGWNALDVTGLMYELGEELGQRADVVVIKRDSPIARRILAEAVPI